MADTFDANEFLSSIGVDPDGSDADTSAVKMLRKTVKELGAKLSAANDKIAAFEKEKTDGLISKTWEDLKVPEPIRKMYHGEKTPEAIKSWWQESKSFFNLEAAGDAGDTSSQGGQPAGGGEPGVANELAQVQQAASLGHDRPENLSADAISAEAAKVKGTSASASPNALAEFLTKLGVPGGGITPPRVG